MIAVLFFGVKLARAHFILRSFVFKRNVFPENVYHWLKIDSETNIFKLLNLKYINANGFAWKTKVAFLFKFQT